MKEERLPKSIVYGLDEFREPMVKKKTLEGIDEIQYLNVGPKSIIKTHGHQDQWEVWVWISEKKAYICPKKEKHACINDSEESIVLMAIKGHSDYSFENLKEVFNDLGFYVIKGDLNA